MNGHSSCHAALYPGMQPCTPACKQIPDGTLPPEPAHPTNPSIPASTPTQQSVRSNVDPTNNEIRF